MSKKHLVRIIGAIVLVVIIYILVRSEILGTARWIFLPFVFTLIGVLFFHTWKVLGNLPPQIRTEQSSLGNSSDIFSPDLHKTVVILLLGTFLCLGLLDIHKQSIVDEPLWIFDRVERYSHRIVEGDLKLSRPSDKPGLPVTLLASVALLKYPTPSALEATITSAQREELFLLMRTPIFLFVTCLIFLFYRSLRKLVGGDIALVTLGFITLSPALLGMSRIINPDAILWILLPFSILTFSEALGHPSKKTVLYAGSIFGLTLLTKYITNILLIFFPVMIALSVIYRWKAIGNDQQRREELRQGSVVFTIVVSIGVILYCLLLPSTWVEPLDILKGTILSQAFGSLALPWIFVIMTLYVDLFARKNSLSLLVLSYVEIYKERIIAVLAIIFLVTISFVLWSAYTHALIDYYTALRSPKSVVGNTNTITVYFTGFYVLIFGVGIPILIGAIIGFVRLLSPKKKRIIRPEVEQVVVVAALFILFYYLGHMVSGVAPTLRYQILVFPLLSIIAAFGVISLIKSQSKRSAYIFVGATAVLLFAELVQVKPYYMSYANSLLPKGDVLNIKDMGDGSYQIAQQINKLPSASTLSIWADKAGICAMVTAKCTTTVDSERIAKEELVFDYFVITKGREFLVSRDARQERRRKAAPEVSYDFESLYTTTAPPVFEINPGNNTKNYIRLFDSSEVRYIKKNDHVQ